MKFKFIKVFLIVSLLVLTTGVLVADDAEVLAADNAEVLASDDAEALSTDDTEVLAADDAEVLVAADTEGNATLGGVNGYITVPSALPVASSKGHTAITTGYTAVFSLPSGFSHIPYLQLGFARNFETSLAFDIEDNADILLSGKWRFIEKNSTSVAFGFIAQALNVGDAVTFGAQTYFASSFSSKFINWPSKTTIMLGYTFDAPLNSNIDFGMGFQAPLWAKGFKGKVDFLIDFGNVSYSIKPGGGAAENRGILNIGLRLLPIEVMRSTFFTADLRLIDILDASDRAISAGVSLSFRP